MTKDMVNHERLAAVNAQSSIEHCPSLENFTNSTATNDNSCEPQVSGLGLRRKLGNYSHLRSGKQALDFECRYSAAGEARPILDHSTAAEALPTDGNDFRPMIPRFAALHEQKTYHAPLKTTC